MPTTDLTTSVTITHRAKLGYEGDERPRFTIREGYGRTAKDRDILVDSITLGWSFERHAWRETTRAVRAVRILKDGREGAEVRPQSEPYYGQEPNDLHRLVAQLREEHRPTFVPDVQLDGRA